MRKAILDLDTDWEFFSSIWGDDEEEEKEATIQIFAKTINGNTLSFALDTEKVSVENLKKMISDRTGLPNETQRIIFAGRQLDNKQLLSHYKILPNSTLHVVEVVRGC